MNRWEYCKLQSTVEGATYTLYRTHGTIVKRIVAPDEDEMFEKWCALIASLGELGWELVNTMFVPTTQDTSWYFKRPIQPDNQYLTL